MEQSGQRSRGHAERRILVPPYATGPLAPTRGVSPRQLPTDHDYEGERQLDPRISD